MIVDSSVLVAILRDEPDAGTFTRAIETADRTSLSAATYLEASVVVTEALHSRLDELVRDMDADLVPFDAEQAQLARRAYADYGRGSGSPARLNFGDCFSYALAQMTGRPLLFKGDDFRHTDVTSAL